MHFFNSSFEGICSDVEDDTRIWIYMKMKTFPRCLTNALYYKPVVYIRKHAAMQTSPEWHFYEAPTSLLYVLNAFFAIGVEMSGTVWSQPCKVFSPRLPSQKGHRSWTALSVFRCVCSGVVFADQTDAWSPAQSSFQDRDMHLHTQRSTQLVLDPVGRREKNNNWTLKIKFRNKLIWFCLCGANDLTPTAR